MPAPIALARDDRGDENLRCATPADGLLPVALPAWDATQLIGQWPFTSLGWTGQQFGEPAAVTWLDLPVGTFSAVSLRDHYRDPCSAVRNQVDRFAGPR